MHGIQILHSGHAYVGLCVAAATSSSSVWVKIIRQMPTIQGTLRWNFASRALRREWSVGNGTQLTLQLGLLIVGNLPLGRGWSR